MAEPCWHLVMAVRLISQAWRHHSYTPRTSRWDKQDAFTASLTVGGLRIATENNSGRDRIMEAWITVLKAADVAACWHAHQRRKGKH